MNWGKRIKITEIFVLFGYRYAVYYYQSIFSHSFRSYEPTRITQRTMNSMVFIPTILERICLEKLFSLQRTRGGLLRS